MNTHYTATLYCKDEKIATETGDDIDELYTWLLVQVDGKFGDIHGEVCDNNTLKIVRKFRKAPIE